MAINRFNQLLPNQRYVSTAVELPFDDILKIGYMKQQAQDKAEADKMELLGRSWNRLPGDTERSKELQSKVNETLSTFSNKDFNDPKVKADWYKTKLELAREFSPNGEIGAQQANYDAYKAYEKDILSKSKELGWSSNQIQQHLNEAKNKFKTRLDDGDLTYFQGKGLANYINTDEWASKALKDVADETGISKLRKYGSLNEVTDAFRSGEINYLDANKIINSLSKRALGNQELMNSLEQEGLFNGKTGNSKFIKGVDREGNIVLDTTNPFGLTLSGIAEGGKFRKEKEDYMQVKNPVLEYQLKQEADNKNLQLQMQSGIQGIPASVDTTKTSEMINSQLESSEVPISKYWKLDNNGELILKPSSELYTETIKIGDKIYNPVKDPLPPGYSYAGKGKVLDITGKVLNTNIKEQSVNDTFEAFQDLASTANRLGIKGSREEVQKAVADYYKYSNNFQMNFTRFPEGNIAALSKAIGVTTKKDADGNEVINNPGRLSFTTIKGLDGKPRTSENLVEDNTKILTGAKILGPAQSLTNINYKAGDMYAQATDGNIYIINTNDKKINDALAPTTTLTQSINKYINTGEISASPIVQNKLNEIFPAGKALSAVTDKRNNIYISFLKDGVPGVIKIDRNGQNPVKLELDEANRIITDTNMEELFPTYNTKNFDRTSKAEETDTE